MEAARAISIVLPEPDGIATDGFIDCLEYTRASADFVWSAVRVELQIEFSLMNEFINFCGRGAFMSHPIKLDDSFRRLPTLHAENALTNAGYDTLSTYAGDQEIE